VTLSQKRESIRAQGGFVSAAGLAQGGPNAPNFKEWNRMTKYWLSGVALAAALAFSGVASAQIKMAVTGPITGPNAAFGAQLVNGAQQAVDDINKAGGILGQKIDLEQGDDVSDPKQGVSVANKFVGDGVKFVVGPFNSGVTIPASDVYKENGILMITPSATNPKVTDRGYWDIFRTCGRDDQQGMVWAEYARDHLKGKKIAIVHDKTTYGKGLADVARDLMHKWGIHEVLYEGVNTGEKDYSAIVSKIKESGADYLMWGGLHTEGGLIIRQMRDQGMKTVMISGDGIDDNEFAQIGGPGVEGTLMTFGPDPRNNPAAKTVVDEFKAKNFDPEAYTLYSYAAVQIIKQAAEKAESLDPKKVAEVMHSGMKFHTVLGDISYDKKGDRTNVDFVWYVWAKQPDGKISYKQM
jgi:branched-chain amino acid transport system substrate-binding protein